MNHQSSLESMQRLKLNDIAKRYESILHFPVEQQPEPHIIIAMLLKARAGYRVHHRTQLYLRLIKLRYNVTLEQIVLQAE